MENEVKDVNQEQVQAPPVQEGNEQVSNVSEDVNTQGTVDKSIYESVRESMKKEREAKKAAQAKNAELEERLKSLEMRQTNVDDNEDYDPYKAKTDILFLMNKDAFVKDNLDLIEEKMTETGLTVQEAIKDVKADFFDRIQKATTTVDNKPPKQEKTIATQEVPRQQFSGNIVQDALGGKLGNISPDQLAAIKRVMGN